MSAMKGLIIDSPHIDNILAGLKSWEMRSTSTTSRGLIALVRKGSGLVVGVADIVGVKGPLSRKDMMENLAAHMVSPARIEAGAVDKWKYAWLLSGARRLLQSVRYRHPSGAVIWVNLDAEVTASVLAAAPAPDGTPA